MEWKKNSMAKSIVFVASIIVFCCGVVVTSLNVGDTYADGYIIKYECNDPVYSYKVIDGAKPYCCDTAYETSNRICIDAEGESACYLCNGKYTWAMGL